MIRIVDVTLVGAGGSASDVVVEGESVLFAGRASECPAALDRAASDSSCLTVSGLGGYVTPGLVNAHCHATNYHDVGGGAGDLPLGNLVVSGVKTLDAFVRRGVAAARDCGVLGANEPLSELVRARRNVPEFQHPGAHIGPPGEFGRGMMVQVETVEGAERAAGEQLDRGARFLKTVVSHDTASEPDDGGVQLLEDALLAAIVRVADRNDTYVAAHACGWAGVDACLRLGVRSIEHGSGLTLDQAIEMRESGAFLVPTINSFGEHAFRGETRWGKSPATVAMFRELHAPLSRSLHIAIEVGVSVACGTDTIGTLAEELQAFIDHGMAPEVAMASVTEVGAKLFLDRAVRGRIDEGGVADLVVWERDPIADVSVLDEAPRLVLRRGLIVG